VITSQIISCYFSCQQIVKMMIVVFVIFAVCWLPYHAFFLVTHWFPEIIRSQHAYLIIYWLAMSNSVDSMWSKVKNVGYSWEMENNSTFWIFHRWHFSLLNQKFDDIRWTKNESSNIANKLPGKIAIIQFIHLLFLPF